MEEVSHSASALAESGNNYTSFKDVSSSFAVGVGEAGEQISERRVGTVEKQAWGFRKVVWIGGVFFVGTVIVALVFGWSSAAKSPVPNSVTRQDIRYPMSLSSEMSDGDIVFLKNSLSGKYLHVSSGSTSNGQTVFHTGSITEGSQWQVQRFDNGGSDEIIMLKSIRSHDYLHVSSRAMGDGDEITHRDSSTEGSKWQVEYAAPFGSLVMLKSLRSGFYLHAEPSSKKVCCDPVFNTDSATDGSKWILEAPQH